MIGADGMRSVVARSVKPREYNTRPPLGCGYYAYFSGVPMDGAEIHYRDDCVLFGFPTNEGQTCVAVEWPNDRFAIVRREHEQAFHRALGQAPDFAVRVARGRRETRFFGIGNIPNFFRTPYGLGWALVGDAGYHKDPITGQGIMDAFLDAAALAEALHDGWSGRLPLLEALARYEQGRNERAFPLYELTIQQASFQPLPPEQRVLWRALQGNQEDTDRFLGLAGGVTSLQEFMAPGNLGRIIARARTA